MKNIKMILITFAALIFMAGGFIIILKSQKTDSKNENASNFKEYWGKDELVIGLDDAYPPIGFRDESGKLIGFDIDLAKEGAKRMGLKAVFKPVEWDSVILTLKSGDIDVVWNTMTVTEERKKQINFSIPYIWGNDLFIVKKSSSIKDKSDLKGKVIGVQAGSPMEKTIEEDSAYKNIKEMKGYSNLPEIMLDMKAGRVDAIFTDDFSGLYYIKNILNDSESFRWFKAGSEPTQMAVGIRKEDKRLKEEIDRVLREMIEDGTATKISDKWFGDDLIVK